MNEVVQAAALSCVAAGLLAAVITVLTTGDGRMALHLALNFWMAGGLLRLGRTPGWEPLLVVVLIVVVRQLAGRVVWRPQVRVAEVFGRRHSPTHPS